MESDGLAIHRRERGNSDRYCCHLRIRHRILHVWPIAGPCPVLPAGGNPDARWDDRAGAGAARGHVGTPRTESNIAMEVVFLT